MSFVKSKSLSSEVIREALSYIPVGKHDDRIRIAFALKAELGEAGRPLWDEWRKGRGDDEANSVWRSAGADGSVTIGTVIHLAQENGWERPTFQNRSSDNREKTARLAKEIVDAAVPAKRDNPYLAIKKVTPTETLYEIEAARVKEILGYSPKSANGPLEGRLLVVPVKQNGRLSTVELIDGAKRKSALPGHGTKAGGYWATGRPLEKPDRSATILLGEGVATCLSAYLATGHHAFAALSASNLVAVAKELRAEYATANITILADLTKTTGTPDLLAVSAAKAIGARLALPAFEGGRSQQQTDFNDMAISCGNESVVRAIEAADEPPVQSDTEAWPDPQPLESKLEQVPFPISAFPSILREAINEIADIVQAPIPLIASSALATLSLASQAHFDVARSGTLKGPIGLYILTIADSGERKSTCDNLFTRPLREYQEEQLSELKPVIKEYEATNSAWKAEYEGVMAEIKSKAKRGSATEELKSRLIQLEQRRPEPPRVPRLLLGDETPENLAWSLAKKWPSAGVLSSEAGVVFGSHGMSRESAMRSLALLNVLWSGESHSIGRRTSESFEVRGARFTMGLMTQEATLLDYFARTGTLARGMGFVSRFLIAWPRSTQGSRFYKEPPSDDPGLTAFHRQIKEILARRLEMDDQGALRPETLTFSLEAKYEWTNYYNDIERELAAGGEFHDVRDVASKSAENAARLAALFHLVAGQGHVIDLEIMESACQVAAWYLEESRRFINEIALPEKQSDAVRLERWLIEYFKRSEFKDLTTRNAQRKSPVRDARTWQALKVLIELNRVRIKSEGKKKLIELNPALVSAAT